MKSKKLDKMLVFKKETVINLNEGEMNRVKGGNTSVGPVIQCPSACATNMPTICGFSCQTMPCEN
jgi:natural product precursor